jgi:hypothetical protein
LIPVENNKIYQLTFAARTDNLVTGGLPFIFLADETTGKILGQSLPIPAQTDSWQTFRVNFQTTDKTEAVRLILKRQNCFSGNCPIFGELRLDGFNLNKL